MARRKAEVQLQQELESQEEWEEMLAKEGLTVVDVYQEWAGPCAAMISTLRRMKNELGDDLLKFAIAKADTIDALEKYRGRCEPCFLYIASGVLVGVVRGANCPLVLRMVTEQLAQEHKVLDGAAERKEIKDPLLAELDTRDEEEEEERSDEEEGDRQLHYKGEIINFDDDLLEMSEEKHKEVTVAIIKPDAVKAGKTDDIMAEMREAGIEIVADEERSLTEEEAREFYSHLEGEEFFEDLIKFMTSGPCHVLVLTKGSTGENIIQEWRHLIGPTSVEEARESAPQSLRAKFGSGSFMNALHGSDSPDRASRELAFFFPNLQVPTVQGEPKLQRTLALIRPDAFRMSKDEILEKIKDAGFQVALQKVVQLTKEQAEEFYKEHQGQDYFEELTNRMSSGPLLALGLAREDAVESWRKLLGPKDVQQAKEEAPDSLRAQYSVDETAINQLHGSDSVTTAQQELDFFFPMQQTVAVIKPDAYGTKDDIVQKIHEAGFRIAARKETQLTREIAEQFYADQKDTEHFNDLVEHMISGPTHFMVLSREDAVEGWRSMLGPKDPEKAKEEAPNTIRALYGTDIKQNAVHGSDNPEKAKQGIQMIFGDLEFNDDGDKVKKTDSASADQTESQQAAETQQESQETQQESQEGASEAAQESTESQEATTQEQQESTAQESSAEEKTVEEEAEEEEEAEDEDWFEEEPESYEEEDDEEVFEEDVQAAESETKAEDSEQKTEDEEAKAEGEVSTAGSGQDVEDSKPEDSAEQSAQDEPPRANSAEQQASPEQQVSSEQQATAEQEASSEQQATPDQQASSEQPATPEQQASSEQQATPEQQASSEQPATPEQQASSEQQATPEQKASSEQQATPEQQASSEQQATPEQKASSEQQATPEQQASSEQQATPEQQASSEQQVTPEQQTSSEQQATGEQEGGVEKQASSEQQGTSEEPKQDAQQTDQDKSDGEQAGTGSPKEMSSVTQQPSAEDKPGEEQTTQ